MTRVSRDLSTATNTYVVECDWDMNRDISDEGYREWLDQSGQQDSGSDTRFHQYITARILALYATLEPIQWLDAQGINWQDSRGVRDGTDPSTGDSFLGFVMTIPSDADAARFEAEWLKA